MRIAIIALAALTLGGCAELASLTGTEFFNEAADTAGDISDATLNATALGIDKYCSVQPIIGPRVRAAINERTLVYDVNLECVPK